jgi:hypothetical protein
MADAPTFLAGWAPRALGRGRQGLPAVHPSARKPWRRPINRTPASSPCSATLGENFPEIRGLDLAVEKEQGGVGRREEQEAG